MKLVKMTLENFRNHEHREIHFSPAMLFTGRNGSGKSTVMHALEYVGTGRCALTDGNGRGGDLATHGQSQGSIALELADGKIATRNTDGHLHLDWALRCKDPQAELNTALGFRGGLDALRVSLRGQRLWEIEAKDKKAHKNLLADIINLQGDLTAEAVHAALTERESILKKQGTTLPLVAIAEKVIGKPKNWDDLKYCYDKVYAERTKAKVSLDEISKTLAGFANVEREAEAETPDADPEALEARLRDLQTELHDYAKEYGQLTGTARSLESARAMLAQAEAGWAAAQQAYSQAPALVEDFAARDAQLEQQILSLEAESRSGSDLVSQLSGLNREHASAKTEAERLTAELDKAGLCPYSTGSACAGAEMRRAAVLSDQEAAVAKVIDLAGRLAAIKAEFRDLRSASSIQADLSTARTEREGLLQAQHERSSAALRLDHAEKALAREKQAVEELEIFSNPERVEEIDRLIPGIKALANDVERELTRLRSMEGVQKQQETLRARLVEAQVKVASLEKLVPFFSPEGYQAEVLKDKMSDCVDAINRVLVRWNLECRYSGDALVLQVKVRGEWFSYQHTSDAQQILVALAHQVAFATLAETGIITVDRIECLDDEGQEALYNAVLDLREQPGMSHVLLFAVRAITPPQGIVVHHLGALQAVA